MSPQIPPGPTTHSVECLLTIGTDICRYKGYAVFGVLRIVKEMACTSEDQEIVCMEPLELTEPEITLELEQEESYDEEAAKLRKHLAQEEALHQFENRKGLALAVSHRMSFNR